MPRAKAKPRIPRAEQAEVQGLIADLVAVVVKARKRKGLSQESFAELLDLDGETIKSIEQGRRFPSLQTLVRAAKALGLRVDLK